MIITVKLVAIQSKCTSGQPLINRSERGGKRKRERREGDKERERKG